MEAHIVLFFLKIVLITLVQLLLSLQIAVVHFEIRFFFSATGLKGFKIIDSDSN